jgi:hypothetical protein
LDDYRAGRRGGEAGLVGGDVVDGVGCHGAGVYLNRVHGRAVDVGCDAEVEDGRRAGDGGAEVGVGCADLDDDQSWPIRVLFLLFDDYKVEIKNKMQCHDYKQNRDCRSSK